MLTLSQNGGELWLAFLQYSTFLFGVMGYLDAGMSDY